MSPEAWIVAAIIIGLVTLCWYWISSVPNDPYDIDEEDLWL